MGHFSVPNIYAHIWMWSVIWTFALTCLRIGISMSIGIGHTIWRQHKNETSFLAKWAVFFCYIFLMFGCNFCNATATETSDIHSEFFCRFFFVIHSIFFCRFFDRFWWKEKVGCNIWLNVVGRDVVAAAGVDVAAVAFMLNNVLFMALTITAARHGLLWPGLGLQWWLKWWCSWYFSWYLLYGMVLMVVAFWATKSCCQNVLCCKYIYMYR